MTNPITGGCQCGAVRYRIESLGRASICHCRMCQKAFGGFFAPLVTANGITWTRGAPSHFKSSNTNRRGFCNACGTPLTYEAPHFVEVSIGSLDDPEQAPPAVQVNPQSQVTYFATLHTIPPKPEAEQAGDMDWNAQVHSYQHPDIDTDTWPRETFLVEDHT